MVDLIRPEHPEDHHAVFRVNESAFGRPDEAGLVDALRRSPAFIPRLSLVALDGAQIVGHILFTAVEVGSGRESHPALALAPMAVLPAFQRRGTNGSRSSAYSPWADNPRGKDVIWKHQKPINCVLAADGRTLPGAS